MPKILLAEDDMDMRRFLVKALQNAGFEVTSYDNGLSAYQRLREEPYELLLTDIVMPEMDGIELARRAAELDPDIKIMFITGFAAVALLTLIRARRGMPRCSRSRFTCASWSTKSKKCWPPEAVALAPAANRSGHPPLVARGVRSMNDLQSFDAEIACNAIGARRTTYNRYMPLNVDASRH
jgi:two-component system cell cycle response regulator CpdR